MWITSQHKCQLPGYDLHSRPHLNWSVPSLTPSAGPSLSHICSSHSACLQSCPSKPSSLLALGPDHWHPFAFSYSWSTQLVLTLQINYPCHWGFLNLRLLFTLIFFFYLTKGYLSLFEHCCLLCWSISSTEAWSFYHSSQHICYYWEIACYKFQCLSFPHYMPFGQISN